MQKSLLLTRKSMMFLALVVGIFFIPVMGASNAAACGAACGWGSSSPGGKDYVPARRGGTGSINGPFLTREQVSELLKNHIRGLNPDLKIGPITDGGSYYEAEIFAKDGEVVERLAVDKQSGGIVPLN